MQKPEVEISDDAVSASVTYINKKKDRLKVKFFYDKDVYYEHAEAPNGAPTIFSQGVELVANVYIERRKNNLSSIFRPQYEVPLLVASERAWVQKKCTEYNKTTVKIDNKVDLWKNLESLEFKNNKNPMVEELIARAQKDVLDEQMSWIKEQMQKARNSKMVYFASEMDKKVGYQNIAEFFANEKE